MSLKFDYSGIFCCTKKILFEKYTTREGATSGGFEREVEKVLRSAIDQWNDTVEEGQKVNINVSYHGGRKFPDYSLNNITYEEQIGIEVKYHDSDDGWETLGNSAVASTQIGELEEIFILFGHFKKEPPEFTIKPMFNCICDIKTTHRPRYSLNMKSDDDFCTSKLGLSYAELRKLNEPQRKIIVNSYIAEKEYIEFHNRDDKDEIRIKCFILFPEVFSSSRQKYERMGKWLFANNIFCHNVRDVISASGRGEISGFHDAMFPKLFCNFYQCSSLFKTELNNMHSSVLRRFWGPLMKEEREIPADIDARRKLWLNLVSHQFGGYEENIADTGKKFGEVISVILRRFD